MAKIPEQAKQVFTGVRYDVFQWPQKMYDQTTETFEMIRRADSVEAIIAVGNKILIQQEEQPHVGHSFLSFPGGCVNQGEEPEEAMTRECLEETGYRVDAWELLHVTNPFHSIVWSMFVFFGRGAKKIAEPKIDCGERITSVLVSFEELLDLVDSGTFYRFEPTLRTIFIRAKYDQKSRQELKSKIFTSSITKSFIP